MKAAKTKVGSNNYHQSALFEWVGIYIITKIVFFPKFVFRSRMYCLNTGALCGKLRNSLEKLLLIHLLIAWRH